MFGGTQIATIRLPDGREVAFVDWQDQPIYSTADLLSGWSDTEVPLFTYVIGDPVSATTNITTRRTASKRDTNVATPGSAAGTEEMLVYSVRPEVLEVQLADGSTNATTGEPRTTGQPTVRANRLATLAYYCTLRLIVSQKIMHEAPFGYYNPGFGAVSFGGYGGAALPAQRTIGSQGLPSNEAVRSYAIPIHVGGTEKYRLLLTNPTSATISWDNEDSVPTAVDEDLLSLRVLLDGLYKRPVA